MPALKRVRTRDVVLNYAVVPAGQEGMVTLNVAENPELSSLDKAHVESFGEIGGVAGTREVEALTLDELLDNCFPEGLHLMSIDIEGLDLPGAQLIIRKGFHKDVDSYSAFEEADRKTVTGLAGYLKARGIDTVFVTGLATDFCVAWTAVDARKAGFATWVIEDATRAIDLNGSLAAAWKDMEAAGVRRIQSKEIAV